MKTSHKKVPKIAVVVSKFNEFITERLLDGCLDEFSRRGINKNNVPVYWVPGSFDIPVVAENLGRKKDIEAVICLGAVIRGETIHFDLVAQEAARGIMQVSLSTGKPIIFGVITTETTAQAYKRSQAKGSNKGRDAVVSALDMIEVFKKIKAAKKHA